MKVDSMKKKATSAFTLFLLFSIGNAGLLNAQIGKSRQQILSEYEIAGAIKEEAKGDAQQLRVDISESGELYCYVFTIQNNVIEGIGITKVNASTGKAEPLPLTKAVEIMRRNRKKWTIFSHQSLQHGCVMFVSPDEREPELYANYLDSKCLTINTKKNAEKYMEK